KVLQACSTKDIKLLYVSPGLFLHAAVMAIAYILAIERIHSKEFKVLLGKNKISMLVVDEA
ncbi:hypothetical protein HDU99_000253, partial [Rhizoclosmatium hyalinum]